MTRLTEVLGNCSGKQTANLVNLTSYVYLMARDCIASNDRVIVDDEFIRETEDKIILKHNKMVNKVKSTSVITS